MKRLLYVFMALCLFASIAGAELKLSWEMDSADDFNLGEDIGGATDRTYITNAVTGALGAGLIANDTVYFDPAHGALRMSGDTLTRIYGQAGNSLGEDPNIIFTSKTQYTFSLWAKGDLNAVQSNGYTFFLFWDEGIATEEKIKCDLGFQPNQSAAFNAPGSSWVNNAYHIWDTDPQYADRYVNPESWNMYTFTWDSDNNHVATYVNGVMRASFGDFDGNDIPALDANAVVTDYGFGSGYYGHGPGGWYRNYRIWDEALDANEVADLVGDFFLKARDPSPSLGDNVVTEGNSIDLTLSWMPGTYAGSHDLYIGTDFNDVNDADNGSAVFEGNLANSNYDITLATGNTYYWRVDEVNDIDVWTGDVWNFNIIKVPDPILLWEMDSADDFTIGDGNDGADGRLYVDNKISGYKYAGMTADTSGEGVYFDPAKGALRMSGSSNAQIYGMAGNSIGEDPNMIFTSSTQYTFSLFAKGDLSAVSGNGYSFYLNFSDDSKFKCDLSWQSSYSYYDEAEEIWKDKNKAAVFSSPGGGWQSSAYHIWDTIEPYATEHADKYVDPETWNMYTFVWDVDSQYIATYVNGIVKGGPMASGTAITAGAVVTDFGFGDYSDGHGPGGWYKDFRVYDTALDSDGIQYLMGDFLFLPKDPNPEDNETRVALVGTVLTWTPGIDTVYQDVYFGQSENVVENAGISSPIYKGQIAVDTYDPGPLQMFKTYYWRVDQLDGNGDLIIKGPVWQFSSTEAIMVEDFESYDNESNDIAAVWTDKLAEGDMQILLMNDPNISPINSMRLRHQIPYSPYYTIASRSFSPSQDWTVNGVRTLTIHYYGDEDNFGLPMFVTVGDGTTDANVAIADVNTLTEGWQEISVSLPEIAAAGVDLNNVSYMEIGLGDGTNLGMSGSKWDIIYIDNIALYPGKCVLSESSLEADITEDCVVDHDDLAYVTEGWLSNSAEGNLNGDTIIDFADYSILASEWLVEDLWP